MSTISNNGGKTTLVEQKKRQWAREREEMSSLYIPWGPDSQRNYRNQFKSTLELHTQETFNENLTQRHRSPSLPPICNKAEIESNESINQKKKFPYYYEDGEGDTSGYGSETVQILNQRRGKDSSHPWQGDKHITKIASPVTEERWNSGGVSSSSGGEERRPKWGDRGVAVGKFWEPQDPPARLPQMQGQNKNTPVWLERGLNMLENSSDILVIDQSSTNSGKNSGTLECDRSSYAGSDGGRNTFLRGQNVPVEPEEKAQRASRRVKALEIQSILKNQLEEREKRNREEKERILKEERMEEQRIKRQQEEEIRRLLEEKNRQEEKEEQEKRKFATLQKAVAEAEEEARQEKMKRWRKTAKRDMKSPRNKGTSRDEVTRNIENNNTSAPENIQCVPNERKIADDHTNNLETEKNMNNGSPRSIKSDNRYKAYLPETSSNNLQDAPVSFVPLNMGSEILSPLMHSGVQLALLVPQASTTFYGVANPFAQSFRESEPVNSHEKVLTPRKYRQSASRDATTQTDTDDNKQHSGYRSKDHLKIRADEYQNIEDQGASECNRSINLRQERRLRSEERFNKKNIENRPKWGVNIPAAQYKKQSEKDPFYAKRKVRQRHRVNKKQYSSQSSDDSRSPSPPTNSNDIENAPVKSRISLSQFYWRSKRTNQYFRPSNLEVESVDIKPIGFHRVTNCHYYKDADAEGNKSPLKRITLSQKFINDKYGNRKLCSDHSEDITRNSNLFNSSTRKNIYKRASMPDIRNKITSNTKSDFEIIN